MRTEIQPAPDEVALPDGLDAELTQARFRVWIDQDLCTGDGICQDLCPDVFVILEDGIAYVREGDRVFNDPGGNTGLARVARHDEADVIGAAQDCPGECIFIETIEETP